jgi:nucleotide-binding universal stress UspA family protein
MAQVMATGPAWRGRHARMCRGLTAADHESKLVLVDEKMTGSAGRAGTRIVVGVDGTAASLTAVRWAAQEAALRQASVQLVFVEDGYAHAAYSGSPEASHADGDDAGGRALLAAAELEAGRALPPGRVSSERAAGSPAKVLIARSAGAELLVLGSAYQAARSATDTWPPMGPVARACLHGAACPVVVLPHRERRRARK